MVHRVLAKHYRPTSGGTGPSLLSFIGHTRDSLWSVDLFRCESIVLRSDWVLVALFEAHRWRANLRVLEIDEIKTVPHVPLSHPFVERLVGTMRREFLDHVLFWNGRDLERKRGEFQAYYNAARCHASLSGHTPVTFVDGPTAILADLNRVRWVSHCRDLVRLPAAA